MENLIEDYHDDNKNKNQWGLEDNRNQYIDSSIQLCKARSQSFFF